MSVQYPLIKTADLKEYAERIIEDFVKTDRGFFVVAKGEHLVEMFIMSIKIWY